MESGTRVIISSKPERWSNRFNIKNMLIKKSCKLYCIKDLYEDGKLCCSKGKFYNTSILGLYIDLHTDKYTIKFNKYSPFHEYTIPEHFITEQGIRKQKLDKILKKTMNENKSDLDLVIIDHISSLSVNHNHQLDNGIIDLFNKLSKERNRIQKNKERKEKLKKINNV